jgi:iron complex outermembrane receptor protein
MNVFYSMRSPGRLGSVPSWLAASLICAPAFAQDAVTVEEIVVTATRREQPLQNVPIAVSAFTGDELADAGIDATSQLSLKTPNVNIGIRGPAFTVFIRGIGTLDVGPGQEPSVATYVDGAYQANPYAAAMAFHSVERIEVIKGPQGTLFGRNATGGLVNIVTKDPSQTPGGDISVSYGNYDTTKINAYGTTGLGENLAADLSLYYENQGKGYGDNITTGNEIVGVEDFAMRSKWLWNIGENTDVRLTLDISRLESARGETRAVVKGSTALDGSTALPDFYDIQSNIDPLVKTDVERVSLRVDHRFSAFDFASITGYNHFQLDDVFDNDATATPLVNVELDWESTTLTQEFQLLSKPGSDWTWIVGAFFLEARSDAHPPGVGISGGAFAPVGLQGIEYVSAIDTSSQSLFGEVTFPVWKDTHLTVGARITRDKKELRYHADPRLLDGTLIPGTRANEKDSYTEPTYRVILDHQLTDDVMLYGSYSRGYKSGTFNTVDADQATGAVDPETVDAFELGAKSDLLDHRLRLNVAAFYNKYKDIQLPVAVGTTQLTVNASDSTIWGLDFDGALAINDRWNITFGAAYLDATYDEFRDAPCSARDPVTGMTTSNCNPDVSGNDLMQAPRTQFNIGTSYRLPTAAGEFDFNLLYWYTDKFYWDVSNRLTEDAYGLLNAQVRWTPAAYENFSITLFGQNITDEKYSMISYAQPPFGDTYAAGVPALYGVEFRLSF